jgi:peptide subunit release factor RF-3
MKLKNLVEAAKTLNKKTLTLDELSKKHDVPVKTLQKQLDKGVKVEMKEHTEGKTEVDEATAKEIALDHLAEFPDYYDRLDNMEEDAEKDHEDGETKEEEKAEEKDDEKVEEDAFSEANRLIAESEKLANAMAEFKKNTQSK